MNDIRPTRYDDLTVIQQIELAAGELFHDVGMSDIAEHPVPTTEALAEFVRAGRSWVVVDETDTPIAFVLVMSVDGLAHIEQISVRPEHARRGVGRRLIDHVDAWAAGQGIGALTLTTFRGVPWNGPYYERIGFVTLEPGERGPELTRLMAEEAAHGLDPAQRIAMRRDNRARR
ncbi:GNAT family N-acetyltransferase [Amorphoplanes digitatis]|uniref:GNAT superfamily N-acetyltransferase n=1 Tax=Actinoplanes digitatis TaxID=1868 RepID=A0A7W7I694_9ACTN|nr:GNAT family N-acetyltransferase [Actinoplanes digitatis]MBB4767247.1 GNAT superfamily N-acetyltransferase [Actinoplanes digitatis]GID97601.1 GCN5 family N-acetyltransferase [Actinoplanes digitatis]